MAAGKSRKFIKTFLDIPRWTGAAHLAASYKSIKSLARSLFTVKEPEFNETFAEAKARLKLTDEMIAKRQKGYFITSMVYLVCSLAMLGYAFHLFNKQHLMAGVSSISLTLVLLSFFFRDHFWYTQMKNKKLGMTFNDWLRSIFGKML